MFWNILGIIAAIIVILAFPVILIAAIDFVNSYIEGL